MLGSGDRNIECGKAEIGQRASKGTRKLLSTGQGQAKVTKVHQSQRNYVTQS